MKFAELVEKINPKLKAIAKRLDGRFTLLNDDDLYQEALVYLWQKYKCRQLADKTDSFILQGCFFAMKNYIRTTYKSIDKHAVSLHESMGDENDTFETIIPAGESLGQRNGYEEGLLVEDIKSRLTEKEYNVFLLCLDGYTTREIGRQMGISHVMVVKIRKKIRSKCRQIR